MSENKYKVHPYEGGWKNRRVTKDAWFYCVTAIYAKDRDGSSVVQEHFMSKAKIEETLNGDDLSDRDRELLQAALSEAVIKGY